MVQAPSPKPGEEIIDMQQAKIFEDHKAKPGERALITMHTVPFEGSVGLVNMLTCTRLIRKGYKVTLLLYGPGVLMASAGRGFPKVGDEAFPGALALNNQLKTIIKEGGTVLACRFALGALYGFRQTDLIEGVKAIHQLDVLDCIIDHQRAGSLVISTWTV
jgi:uncharacterized repeat protein (TIGR04044 family)